MHYQALAFDYDGTLAKNGHVGPSTLHALEQARAAGYLTLMVTGRELTDLKMVFPRLDLFDVIVAENGAELHWPAEGRGVILGEPPSPELVAEMQRLDVTPYSVGKVIFATWRPHEVAVAEAIARLGLDYQIIFNKKAVMVLPKHINKASGLLAALQQLRIEPQRVAGIGDAENDLPFLRACGFAATVANALDVVKTQCQFVATRDHGEGVEEMIDAVLRGTIDQFPTKQQSSAHAASNSKLASGG